MPNFSWAEPNSNKADPNTTTTLSTSPQKSKFLNNYQIFFKEFYENKRHLPAGLQIRYRETAFKSSLVFRRCSVNPLHLNNVLICSTLHFPGRSSNFETGTFLKTLNCEQKWSQTVRFHATFLRPLAEMANVCQSLGGWGVTFLWTVCSAIDSDAELFMYLFNALGSAHKKFGIWTRP